MGIISQPRSKLRDPSTPDGYGAFLLFEILRIYLRHGSYNRTKRSENKIKRVFDYWCSEQTTESGILNKSTALASFTLEEFSFDV